MNDQLETLTKCWGGETPWQTRALRVTGKSLSAALRLPNRDGFSDWQDFWGERKLVLISLRFELSQLQAKLGEEWIWKPALLASNRILSVLLGA